MQTPLCKKAAAFLLAAFLSFGLAPAAFAGTPCADPSEPTATQDGAGTEKSALELYSERLGFLNSQNSALDVEFILQPSKAACTQMQETQLMDTGDQEYFNRYLWVLGWIHMHASFTFPNGEEKSSFFQYAFDGNGDGQISQGETAYCIEPYVKTLPGDIYNSTETSAGIGHSSPWGSLTPDQQRAVGLAILYGYPNTIGDGSSVAQRLCDQLATAATIHEIVLGWRDPLPPYDCTDSTYIDSVTDPENGAYFSTGIYVADEGLQGQLIDYDRVRDSYEKISKSLAMHTVPGFAASSPEDAPAYTMEPTGDGKYSVTLTDGAGALSGFSFPDIPGLSFLKNGSQLTVVADSCGDIPDDVIEAAGKELPSAEKSAYLVWNGNKDGVHSQDLVGLKPGHARFAPLSAYFRLKAPPTGSLRIEKKVNSGTLSGWRIGVYTDAACTEHVSGSPFVTTGDGILTVDGLLPGTYYVKEVDESPSYPGWKFDTSSKDIVVFPGQTSKAGITNILQGRIIVKKNAVNGSPEGWVFEIRAADGSLADTVTTGEDGRAVSRYLEPGNYTVREIHGRNETYWTYDSDVEKKVTVTPGADKTAAYTNEQFSRVKIVKKMDTDGPLEGWKFRITDSEGKEIPGSPFISGKDGAVTTEKLKPGTYTVEELLPEDSLYFCKTENPKTITAAAGKTAVVSFTNALRPGKIEVQKTDSSGSPLSGAKFLLEWSKDGHVWKPVFYSGGTTVTPGGCSNKTVAEGYAISGGDGMASWENLYPGIYYRITETEAPEGYSLLKDAAWEGRLPVKDLSIRLRVVDTPLYALPQTGGGGFIFIPAALVLFGITGACALWIQKKAG